MVVIKDKSVINKIRKAKTRRGKRVLESREPLIVENTKKAIFTRGSNASQRCVQLLKDFCLLKKPNSVYFNRKEEWHPFDDWSPVEYMCGKNDASLFAYASHTKKRPNNVVIGRTFDDHLLDMVELGFDDYRALNEFKVPKTAIGTKPIVLFSGQPFDTEHDYQRLKSLLLDMFAGPQVDSIRLSGLEHAIQFVATDGRVLMRSYKVALKRSGTRLPRVELEEMGPRVEFTLRRRHLASQDLWKRALRQPDATRKKSSSATKNVKRDALGSTLGRIHMRRQDYRRLSLRKSRAFRKSSKEGISSGAKKTSVVPVVDTNDRPVVDTNRSHDMPPKKRVRFES
ncbi:unnamed protein product [Medioppia subpectinata]|uniref:Ribosome production factor 2 homolog n=1 Tax=Medioppia subpectinata TaxID=1979941 RepID=A0A7R9KLH8_9ACAR|nr:unnamed protein product [Medioppia subpectinata]CAG2105823.1 unnamed protein product [Medioppia subpectinata]